METFFALLAVCEGNSPVTSEFPSQRPVTRSFDVLFDLHLNEHLNKQSWGRRFETPSRPLWRHCNVRFEPWYIKQNIDDTSSHNRQHHHFDPSSIGPVYMFNSKCLAFWLLTHWGLDEMAEIVRTTFWNAFSSMKNSHFYYFFIEVCS